MDQGGRSDWESVRRVQAGETDAFEALVRRHEKAVINLLYRWLGDYDEAAEVAQEVFLSAYRSIRRFRGDAKFSTWLYRIAVNLGKNRRKSMLALHHRMMPIENNDPVGDAANDPVEVAEKAEVHNLVQQSLKALETDDALLILLHDLQDVPYEEIAHILDIPIGTVKSRLHRARQALRPKLAPYFASKRGQK
jgi:RNA polymerase sigma-70 factor (ECF subfamily)